MKHQTLVRSLHEVRAHLSARAQLCERAVIDLCTLYNALFLWFVCIVEGAKFIS